MIYLIADCHLSAETPELLQALIDWLGTTTKGDQLYILGDFFDRWIGDDECHSAWCKPLLSAMHQAHRRGMDMQLITGNRDFLLSDFFTKISGCQIYHDTLSVRLPMGQVLLMHGDTLCKQDHGYQWWRLIYRMKWLQALYLKLSPLKRKAIAGGLRQKSQEVNQRKNPVIMDVCPKAVQKALQDSSIVGLVHGHTHRPSLHQYDDKWRLVLPSWHQGAWLMVIDEAGWHLTRLGEFRGDPLHDRDFVAQLPKVY
jgi:UDP-2,3-diacylglucosamine hydrolase